MASNGASAAGVQWKDVCVAPCELKLPSGFTDLVAPGPGYVGATETVQLSPGENHFVVKPGSSLVRWGGWTMAVLELAALATGVTFAAMGLSSTGVEWQRDDVDAGVGRSHAHPRSDRHQARSPGAAGRCAFVPQDAGGTSWARGLQGRARRARAPRSARPSGQRTPRARRSARPSAPPAPPALRFARRASPSSQAPPGPTWRLTPATSPTIDPRHRQRAPRTSLADGLPCTRRPGRITCRPRSTPRR